MIRNELVFIFVEFDDINSIGNNWERKRTLNLYSISSKLYVSAFAPLLGAFKNALQFYNNRNLLFSDHFLSSSVCIKWCRLGQTICPWDKIISDREIHQSHILIGKIFKLIFNKLIFKLIFFTSISVHLFL